MLAATALAAGGHVLADELQSGRPSAGTALLGTVPAAHVAVEATSTSRPAARRLIERYLQRRPGHAAVGTLDVNSGEVLCVHCRQHFITASIVKLDFLEALLLRDQRAGSFPDADERSLAASMIEDSDNDSATDLYDDVGGAAGLTTANAALGLSDTTVDAEGYWGLTSTTVADQLQLLADLTPARHVLDPRSRRFARHLLTHVVSGQRWGVPAAATDGQRALVKDGWLPHPSGWCINSDGLLVGGGLPTTAISVLSYGSPTESDGIRTVQRLATLAADDR